MDLWIGTSGYVYPEWNGFLYPRGTPAAKMLALYAEHFPLVELNFSYYQMPTAERLARMAESVPRPFQFIIKAHRTLTHFPDESQLSLFSESLMPLRASGQLAKVLCQFPQRIHFSSVNRQWIDHIQNQLSGVPLAVEFRHLSWDRPEISHWLRERGITLVSVDVPDAPSLFPRKLVQTGPEIYLRLHSRRASSWHSAGPDRYDYAYSDEELQEWITTLAGHADQIERALVLFNNCRRANAVLNARRLAALLSQQPHPINVVHAPLPTNAQGYLFDSEPRP